ncbi:hypothetical protein N7465_011251 [Penicillium sp. CMV-2018d]|nr:hypothetical protein N7465_011251 [Penicillium sp. CMV-2018d]
MLSFRCPEKDWFKSSWSTVAQLEKKPDPLIVDIGSQDLNVRKPRVAGRSDEARARDFFGERPVHNTKRLKFLRSLV